MILTSQELSALRRAVGDGVVPITWGKPTINADLQGAEDVLETLAFAAAAYVIETTVINPDAQLVQTALDTNQYIDNMRPLVRSWLEEHPAEVTTRVVNAAGISAYVKANLGEFPLAVFRVPDDQRVKLIELVATRRVEAAV